MKLFIVPIFGYFMLTTYAYSKDQIIIEHTLDKMAWTQPVTNPNVYVLVNYRKTDEVFGRRLDIEALKAFDKDGSHIMFGTSRGLDIVIVGAKAAAVTLKDIGARAVAAHESFHMAVQYQTLRPRFDSIQLPTSLSEADERTAGTVLHNLLKSEESGHEFCRSLKHISNLDDNLKLWFIYKSYTEWPAEWYMRHSVLKKMSFDGYLDLRRQWGGGEANPLYVTGLLIMDHVDKVLGRAAWQIRYMKGDHPLNMAADAYGCARPLGPNFQVLKWKLNNIFETDVDVLTR